MDKSVEVVNNIHTSGIYTVCGTIVHSMRCLYLTFTIKGSANIHCV